VSGQASLYDLEKDPRETTDISGQYPDLTQQLSRSIALAMLPQETALHVWITRGYNGDSQRFTGTIRIEGGIQSVQAFLLTENDTYKVEGDTVTFDIWSSVVTLGPNKHLCIIPATGAQTVHASVHVGGAIGLDRFFPYGTDEQVPSGEATINFNDYPLGPNLPLAMEEYPASCYLWGVRGRDRQEPGVQLDEQTKEQLRALGYVN
jgi:hypothetical protein